ncbi:MAG: serine/threonine protein kinase [Deltaproteobacteria bacterium]|nr:serine/threonine protein kinase [Deltaproteobacteria bacterium]
MELKEGAVIAERFRLLRLLGKGGMGDVWAAQHISLDITCAVKFIHAEAAEKPEVRERFEREAKAAAALKSPNVVQIIDYGIQENVPYLAMEMLEGEPLSARIRRRGRLEPIETCRIVGGIGKALTKAHAAGIVHRDLKPENVFLVPDEDGEIAKVLDFGVAKNTNQLDSNTRTGALLGTPYFMSPEQAQGIKAVDARADLWSLAVVAFRCITGELPFKSDALGDLLIRIVTQPPPVPSHVCPGLPESFDRWWHRASQREPEHRYQTAKELCDALSISLGVSMPTGSMVQSLAGLQPPLPMQKTVALPEMMTPMPGQAVPFEHAAQVGAPPYGGGYSGASGPYPATGGYAGNSGNYQVGYPTPQPFGDSGAMGSVAGISATPVERPPAAKKTGVLVVALLGAAAVIGIAAFLFLPRGDERAAAPGATASAAATASSPPPASPSAVASSQPLEVPTPPLSASPPEASAQPSAAGSSAPTATARDSNASPPSRPPPPPPRTTTRPPPPRTTTSRPKTGGYDPGF